MTCDTSSIITAVIVLFLGLMGFLVKSWINSVNKRLDTIFGLIKSIEATFLDHESRIAWLEGKANGRHQ